MAEEIKKKGRPKKSTTEDTKTTKDATDIELESNSDKEMIAKLMEQMAQMQKQLDESQKKIQESNDEKVGLQELVEALKSQGNNNNSVEDDFKSKKIKCISLMRNPINISTEPDGNGRVFTFDNYGDSKLISFDNLSDICSSYPYTMEHGFIYIANKEAVDKLDLTDAYTKIYDKETMDKIVLLREEMYVDLFIGMEENLRESTAVEIARKLNANEEMDYNYLRRIKNEIGIDIEKIAEDIKEEQSTDKNE